MIDDREDALEEELEKQIHDERAIQRLARWAMILVVVIYFGFVMSVTPAGDSFCAPFENGLYEMVLPEEYQDDWHSSDQGFMPISRHVSVCTESHLLWSQVLQLGYKTTMEDWLAGEPDTFEYVGVVDTNWRFGFLPEVVGWPVLDYHDNYCIPHVTLIYGEYHAIVLWSEQRCQ